MNKVITFPLTLLGAYLKFIHLANLNEVSRVVDGTSQDGCVTMEVSGKLPESLEKAKDLCLYHGSMIITMYGAFLDSESGRGLLKKMYHQNEVNDEQQLKTIFSLIA